MIVHNQLSIWQILIAVTFTSISLAISQLINARLGSSVINVCFFFATCATGGIAFGTLFRQTKIRALAGTLFATALFFLRLGFWLLPT